MLRYLLYFVTVSFCLADTNNINYENLQMKEQAHDKLENLYFLKIFSNKKTDVILTGRNIIEYNNFNSINRVNTCTTIKINF